MWLTFDLTRHLDLGFFKVKFWNSCISGIIWLMRNEKKANQVDTGSTVWPCPLTTPMILTLKFQSKFEITLFQEKEGWLTWNKMDVSRSFMNMIVIIWVTMMGWVDVPDSGRGDYWRRHAVNISSYSKQMPGNSILQIDRKHIYRFNLQKSV